MLEIDEAISTAPLLYLDVHLEDGKAHRLPIHKEDDADVVAKSFAEEHGIKPSMVNMLASEIRK